MFNGLNCRKFSLLDPIHQFPWASTLVHDFVDFIVEECSLGILDRQFERLPVFVTSLQPVCTESISTQFRPPLLGVFGGSRFLSIFEPHLFNNYTELIDNLIKFIDVFNIRCVQFAEVLNNILDELSFLFAVRRYSEFGCLNGFFKDGDVDNERYMV